MTKREWRPTAVVAWTQHEGPDGAPRGAATWMWIATAATLAVAFSAVFMNDTFCPEHRLWVQTLVGTAFFGSVVSLVALVRGWAAAPWLTIGVALIGCGIGAIEAAHAPLRGGVIAAAFLLTLASSAWLAKLQLQLVGWDRRLQQDAGIQVDAVEPAPSTVPAEDDEVGSPVV